MLKKKNAMELSINMIILVIIGLIVLVVIMALFSRESGKTVNTLEGCPSRGGECKAPSGCTGVKIYTIDECNKNSKICCVNV